MRLIAIILLLSLAGCYSSAPPVAYSPSMPPPGTPYSASPPPAVDYDCYDYGFMSKCKPQGDAYGVAPTYKCYDYGYKTHCEPQPY